MSTCLAGYLLNMKSLVLLFVCVYFSTNRLELYNTKITGGNRAGCERTIHKTPCCNNKQKNILQVSYRVTLTSLKSCR